jgi:citrate lyase subunit beta / citryl-CoA lyase
MVPYRSILYIPGNRPTWMENAADYGADCLILDLEDSVPAQEKESARPLVKTGIKALKAHGQLAVNVRVNGLSTGMTHDDLEAVLCPELDGIYLPKVETVEDMKALDALLTDLEKSLSITVGSILTPLVCETAKSMRIIYEIATSCPRVQRVDLAVGPGGDAARDIGYIWSKGGMETLFLRSKAILDSRAAGIRYPTIGSWWNIRDLQGLERDARWNRQLGFRGQTVMYPSHVHIVNEVFTPSIEEITFCKGLIDAMQEAKSKGVAAIVYKGDMVDEAVFKTALETLEFAKSIGIEI